MQLTPAQTKYLWSKGILDWKLHSAQQKIYNTLRTLPPETREAVVLCSRRFGKSYLGCVMGSEDCQRKPNSQVFVIGPDRRQTKKIVRPIMRKIMEDAPVGLITPTSQDEYKFANGSVLILAGFDSAPEAMRGMDADAIYLEETGQAPEDLDEYLYMLTSVFRPTLMHSRGRIYHLTTPSKIVDHPLHVETIPAAKLNNAFFKFTIKDNPLLSQEDIANEIYSLGGEAAIHARRELFCEIVREDSLVAVPTFSEERHVFEEIYHRQDGNYLVAGDFGGTTDLYAFLLMIFDHELGRPCVIDEKWFENNTPTSTVIRELKHWDTFTKTRVVDCSSQTRIDMASGGYAAGLPKKAEFLDTLYYLRNEFFKDQVLVHPRCRKLIETLRSGTLNKTRTDFTRTPTLGHCDMLMALVYGLRFMDRFTDKRTRRVPFDTFVHPNSDSKTPEFVKQLQRFQ